MKKLSSRVLWITQTAVLLALLVTLQSVTKPLGQIVTGSCVNAVLVVSALLLGWQSGLCIAAISPVMAYLLQIAPKLEVLPAIIAGNIVYVLLLALLGRGEKPLWKQGTAVAVSAAAKFAALWLLVTQVTARIVKLPPALLVQFSWPQLATALIGGAAAVLIVPMLKKALRRA